MFHVLLRIRRHLADPASHHAKIASGFVLVGLFVFLGKLAGAAKEMAMAWRYGISEEVDAYVFALNLINWPVSVWLSLLTVVLVPLITAMKNSVADEKSRFRDELFALTLLCGVLLGVTAYLILPAALKAGWVGLEGHLAERAATYSQWFAPLVPMGMVIGLFSARTLALGWHRNTLFEAAPSVAILLMIIAPPQWVSQPLLWGTLTGVTLHMLILALPLHRAAELRMPRLRFTSPAWSAFAGGVGIMAAAQALMSVTGIVDQIFAANLEPGALSTLNYSNRVLGLLLGIVALAISRATLPVLSKVQAENDGAATRLALQWSQWMFVTSGVLTAVAWLASPLVVKALFERGAFTPTETAQVSTVLRFSLLQLPFYAASLVLVSLIAAQKRYMVLFFSALLALAVKIPLLGLLVPIMQVNAIALSAGVVYLINALFCVAIVRLKPRHALSDRTVTKT